MKTPWQYSLQQYLALVNGKLCLVLQKNNVTQQISHKHLGAFILISRSQEAAHAQNCSFGAADYAESTAPSVNWRNTVASRGRTMACACIHSSAENRYLELRELRRLLNSSDRSPPCCKLCEEESNEMRSRTYHWYASAAWEFFPAVILLDWSGVDLTPKSTPYAKKLVELQDSNAAPDQIYTINSKS